MPKKPSAPAPAVDPVFVEVPGETRAARGDDNAFDDATAAILAALRAVAAEAGEARTLRVTVTAE